MINVIAEPANYWQGDQLVLHRAIVDAAAAGCAFFKMQLYDTNNMGKEWEGKRRYYKQCELSVDDLIVIEDQVGRAGMDLLITVFQTHLLEKALARTENIKIASGQFSRGMAAMLKIRENDIGKLFISTGMISDIEELEEIYQFADASSIPEIIVMHCVSLYPPERTEINMDRIETLRDFFRSLSNVQIGYSDHGFDNISALIAASKGVQYIELHLANSGMYGKTSEIAYTSEELVVAVDTFQKIGTMLGTGQLLMQEREGPVKKKYFTRWKNSLVVLSNPAIEGGSSEN